MRSSSHGGANGIRPRDPFNLAGRLTVLPEMDTPERHRLEHEALQVGLLALEEEYGNLPNTMYRIYAAYRTRLLKERGLIDAPPGEEWQEALTDAKQIQAHVNDSWVRVIREATANRVEES